MRFINLILSNFIGQLTTSMVETLMYRKKEWEYENGVSKKIVGPAKLIKVITIFWGQDERELPLVPWLCIVWVCLFS